VTWRCRIERKVGRQTRQVFVGGLFFIGLSDTA
jgi:hypothetical protein